MMLLTFLDVPPGPVDFGVAALVIFLVVGFVVLLLAALVLYLWLRKRGMRHEIIPSAIDLQNQTDVRK